METLKNAHLSIQVSAHGAELSSIIRNDTQREYLWQADPAYWKRHSPVLFPIVGSVWNGEYRQNGTTYRMSQHGFARDMEFELMEKTDSKVVYRLISSAETHEKYPYDFVLEIGYELKANQVRVMWTVKNPTLHDIHFQIGAHPAFNYMGYDAQAEVQGYFAFDESAPLEVTMIGEKGCISEEKTMLQTDNGVLPISRTSFENDAIVLEQNQVHEVTLLDAQKVPYLKVAYNAPVVGLWSPKKDEYAPFVCIEPWYGRCDRMNYEGQYEEKDWMQHLKPGEKFHAEYTIEVI